MTLDPNHGPGVQDQQHEQSVADIGGDSLKSNSISINGSQGSSIQESEVDNALNQVFSSGDDSHNHASPESKSTPSTSEGGFKQHNGSKGQDVMVGDAGNDFIFPGEGSFQFNTANTNSGAEEFPFPNNSQGSTELNLDLKDGTLKVDGEFKDFDGAPLFSQGETEIDPKAEILNGSDPDALVQGFLEVPKDVEGNPLTGTHLHFSPAGDDRGDFADATAVRFFDNTVNEDGKSGTISSEFELNPEEQAALLAGNLYVNAHSNLDVDGDGRAGFPTGENRVNLNQNVVEFV
ncbi:MAG: CHRD domain-containing protein [Oculatellaceae cyanobacterium bins.114]|nr:CHRD domain-containing protein [Oculatellaceae cyanobacterium bins.114]